MKESECILILESVYSVMKAEKEIQKHGVKIDIIPTPRELSHDCGVVIRFRCEELDAVRKIVQETGFPQARFFRKNANGSVEMLA